MSSTAPLSSISYWNQFLRYSEEHEIELDKEGIDTRLQPYKNQDFVPFELFKDLVHEIWKRSNSPALGLEFAESIQLSNHGSLGFAISHGVDLNECLNLINRYYETRLQAIKLSSEVDLKYCIITLEETCDWEPIRTLLYEVMLFSLANVIKFIIGKEVTQCTIYFPYQAPEWSGMYEDKLPCSYSFNNSVAQIVFPKSLLNIKSLSPNKHTLTLAASQCDAELARLKTFDSFKNEIVRLIEDASYKLTSDEAASALHISKSTLTRRLKEEGSSFGEIVADIKKQRAIELLTTTDQSIEAIALSLDYEDSSNFNRSFKRWLGCSPSAYRAEHSLLR